MTDTTSSKELSSLTSSVSHLWSLSDIESNRIINYVQIVWFTGGIQNPTDDLLMK